MPSAFSLSAGGCTGPPGLQREERQADVQDTCILHNFLREKEPRARSSGPGTYSHVAPEERGPAAGLADVRDVGATHNHTRRAAEIRDRYVAYFSGDGSVPWQLGSIRG